MRVDLEVDEVGHGDGDHGEEGHGETSVPRPYEGGEVGQVEEGEKGRGRERGRESNGRGVGADLWTGERIRVRRHHMLLVEV